MIIATQIGNSGCIFREEATQKGGDRKAEDFVEELERGGVASESARTHSTHKESCWFCEEVQTKVAMKQSRFKERLACIDGNQKDIDLAKERHKVAKREAKMQNVRYVKDEGGRTIMREEYITKRWGEYFSSLFNESPPIESRPERSGDVGSFRHQMHYDYCHSRINQGEVRDALQRIRRNKVVGPDQIPIEAWRYEVLHQEVDLRIEDWIFQPKEFFRYLGSVIHRSGRIDEDVAHRIRVGAACRALVVCRLDCLLYLFIWFERPLMGAILSSYVSSHVTLVLLSLVCLYACLVAFSLGRLYVDLVLFACLVFVCLSWSLSTSGFNLEVGVGSVYIYLPHTPLRRDWK
nr:hypothetical protein [Tanacetum cinerariifolium]